MSITQARRVTSIGFTAVLWGALALVLVSCTGCGG